MNEGHTRPSWSVYQSFIISHFQIPFMYRIYCFTLTKMLILKYENL